MRHGAEATPRPTGTLEVRSDLSTQMSIAIGPCTHDWDVAAAYVSAVSVQVPTGYSFHTRTDGSGDELRPQQPAWGWSTIALMIVWCLGWDTVLLSSVGIGLQMSWAGWPEDLFQRWAVFFPTFWVPGIAFTAVTLYQIFVRHAWVLSTGVVARRYAVPLLRLSWQCTYDVAELELHHARWSTGRGANDALRLVNAGGRIDVAKASRRRRLPAGPPEWSDRVPPRAMDQDVVLLGQFFAERTRLPLRFRQTLIEEPTSD